MGTENSSKTGNTEASKNGKFVLLIGPSGVGKSVILRHLRSTYPQLHFPRSATTRERRKGEGDDLYHFVSDAEFDELMAQDTFLESATVHGVGRYATMIDEIVPYIEQGKTVVREVDVQGFESIRKSPLFAGDNAPYRLQSIFIVPENTEQLIRRIQKRAPITEEELARRVASMDKELAYAKHCTHQVINIDHKLDDTIKEVEDLVMNH